MDDIDRERYRSNPRDDAPGSERFVPAGASRRPAWLAFEASVEPTGWFTNLVLLVVLCVVLMAVATAGLRQWRPGPVGGPTTTPITVAQNVDRAAIRTDLAITDELERRARATAAQLADERRQAAIRDREAEEEAAQRAAALEVRWDREWRAYYKKPAHCEESLPDVDSVGCANDYIRARRAFDEQFAAAARRR